ncbi:hypothetical protein SOVF_011150 [Spinacia oleracea]|uniref:Probable serine/threonine-protein kinase PBL7 n=1 Tax=Spinacia oleracea TaxID=3562 RepID=A0ABM3QVZ6_SPIOL|nr:probable serine/threonine-protein kinase PBL7 [Spinacia oleracea]KNA24922.1 hypothetical protein SOVF_011150 [Spinacia oleracea]
MNCFCYGSSSQISNVMESRQSQLDIKEPDTAEISNNDSGPLTKVFTLKELTDAAKKCSRKCPIDVGSFGKVYRGKLGETGEVTMLSLLKHPNLINLIGYCAEGNRRFLVHEYLPLGSLDQHLHDRSSKQKPLLSWYTRMKIALGTANALEYLHDKADPPVIYRNLQPCNILLDNDFNAKLCDFGLSKLGDAGGKVCRDYISAGIRGTGGYIAPEYVRTGLLTVKADVYNFGVVLLELVTGRRAVDIPSLTTEDNLVSWAHRILEKPGKKFPELADPLLQGNFPARGFHSTLLVAAMCLQYDLRARPIMSSVVAAIMYISSDKLDENIDSPPL